LERPAIARLTTILCVLPPVPESSTGGGVLLLELLAFLASRGRVAAVVPVNDATQPLLAACAGHPDLAGIEWHGLTESRTPGFLGYVERLGGQLPSDAAKVATAENHVTLERLRKTFEPTVELAVSSWALAAYRGQKLPHDARLFMINVDPEIVRYDGPSLKRWLACMIDRPKVDRLCRTALATAGHVGAISAADVPTLNRMGGRQDVAYMPPLMRPRLADRSHVDPGTLLITTNFTYSPNVTSLEWFFRECWPHVSEQARLTVTGKDDNDRLARLCRSQPRTTYAGCLPPAELDDAFARTAVAVNPTRLGSGFQIKLLDALARGVPVVSTAFSNTIGPAIPSSDNPRELAALINARLSPGSEPAFDYAAFHDAALAAWDRFLFGRLTE
jgi:hypothetical protein